ncbi:hypothetical protein CYMTET_48344 [Cymbomonas tetramitiformis]|uniref:RRM domain-containing protein n=1 Tax=Cymbomonas tetramitiformis TaxID=36881 RepID=A0AAE0BSK8_9CHLO|nr:hypothetical protein CYMTET_48344 [Cymbomonas tetramitiformis]
MAASRSPSPAGERSPQKEPSKERDRSPKKGRDKEDDRSPVKGRDKGEDRSPEKSRSRSRSPRDSRSRSRSPRKSRSPPRRSRSRSRSRSPRDRSPARRRSDRSPDRRDRQQEYRDKEDGCKIFIGGLAYETDDYALRKKFEKYGSITDVYIPVDTDNRRPRGFAFVTFGDPRDAEDSVRAMDGRDIDGRPVTISIARPRPPPSAPRGYGTTNKAVVPGEVVAGFLTMMVAVVVATRIETIAMKTNAMKTGAGVLIEIGIEFFFQMNRVRETSF